MLPKLVRTVACAAILALGLSLAQCAFAAAGNYNDQAWLHRVLFVDDVSRCVHVLTYKLGLRDPALIYKVLNEGLGVLGIPNPGEPCVGSRMRAFERGYQLTDEWMDEQIHRMINYYLSLQFIPGEAIVFPDVQ
jgi:hypothetical protein